MRYLFGFVFICALGVVPLVYEVETRATSQLFSNVSQFDVSSDGGVVAYTERVGPGVVAIYDRGSGNITRLDLAGHWPGGPCISGDGQVVAFTSVAGGDNYDRVISLYDRTTEQIERAATHPLATSPSLSKHGGFLAYMTGPSLADGNPAIYVLDRATGETTLVSVNSDGEPANAHSERPLISETVALSSSVATQQIWWLHRRVLRTVKCMCTTAKRARLP